MTNNATFPSDQKPSLTQRLAQLQPVFNHLRARLNDPPSEKTEAKYERDHRRMKDQGLLPEQIGKNSRRSYNSYRAALVWCTILEIDRLYAELCDRVAGMSADQVRELLDRIEAAVGILHRYPPGSNTMPSLWQAPAGGAVRKSKRRGLGTLPALWRQQLLQACPPASPYFVPLIVLMLTGLRPEELRKGAWVTIQGAEVAIGIRGAKVTKIAGQPLRTLSFGLDNPLAKYLAKHVQAHGGAGLKVGIKSPGALAAFVRRLSKRTFGRHRYLAAPYSFRHQFAADRKAEKVPAGDIGAMLGHAVDRSSSGYGTSGQGKGRTLCRVAAFTATRAVRAMPVSKAAAAWMAEQPNLASRSQCSPALAVPAPRMM